MVSFYKDKGKRILNPTLFSDVAMDLAEKIYNSGRGKANKRSQLRKFFDEVLRLKSLSKNEDWGNILPYVNMLLAKSVYAEGRGNTTSDFTRFIKESINEIRNQEDLEVFATFFEAFMGFYRKLSAN